MGELPGLGPPQEAVEGGPTEPIVRQTGGRTWAGLFWALQPGDLA